MEFETKGHKAKYAVALDTIMRVYEDTCVSKEQVIESLSNLKKEIDSLIDINIDKT